MCYLAYFLLIIQKKMAKQWLEMKFNLPKYLHQGMNFTVVPYGDTCGAPQLCPCTIVVCFHRIWPVRILHQSYLICSYLFLLCCPSIGPQRQRIFMLAQLRKKRKGNPRVLNCHAETVPRIWLAVIMIYHKVIIQGQCYYLLTTAQECTISN